MEIGAYLYASTGDNQFPGGSPSAAMDAKRQQALRDSGASFAFIQMCNGGSVVGKTAKQGDLWKDYAGLPELDARMMYAAQCLPPGGQLGVVFMPVWWMAVTNNGAGAPPTDWPQWVLSTVADQWVDRWAEYCAWNLERWLQPPFSLPIGMAACHQEMRGYWNRQTNGWDMGRYLKAFNAFAGAIKNHRNSRVRAVSTLGPYVVARGGLDHSVDTSQHLVAGYNLQPGCITPAVSKGGRSVRWSPAPGIDCHVTASAINALEEFAVGAQNLDAVCWDGNYKFSNNVNRSPGQANPDMRPGDASGPKDWPIGSDGTDIHADGSIIAIDDAKLTGFGQLVDQLFPGKEQVVAEMYAGSWGHPADAVATVDALSAGKVDKVAYWTDRGAPKVGAKWWDYKGNQTAFGKALGDWMAAQTASGG